MQTFLPFPDIKKSLRCLDDKRLGKQRVEAYQILKILKKKRELNPNTSLAWSNHPAVLMWEGYEDALIFYYNTSINIWQYERLHNNTMQYIKGNGCVPKMPLWFGDLRLHGSHQSNLLRKDSTYYSKHFEIKESGMPYYWAAIHKSTKNNQFPDQWARWCIDNQFKILNPKLH